MSLLLMLLLMIQILFSTEITSKKPNLVLLREQFLNISRLVCIAEGNDFRDAMVFNTSTDLKINTSVSYYVSEASIEHDNFNCDFENLETCHQFWKSQPRSTLENTLDPVILDERWESFPTLYTEQNKYFKILSINNDESYKHIGISIKSDKNAAVGFCFDDSRAIPDQAFCYWFIIDTYHNNKVTQFERCPSGLHTCSPIETTTGDFITRTEWRHFILSYGRTFGVNRMELYTSDNSKLILQSYRIEVIPRDINVFINSRSNSKGAWKIHSNHYVTVSRIRFLTPRFSIRKKSLCISLYAAICDGCSMVVGVRNGTGNYNLTSVLGKNIDKKIIWQHVKTELYPGTNYEIYAYSPDKNFIAVDNIRMCSNKEIRVLKLYSKSPDITCSVLSHPEWTVSTTSADQASERPPIMEDVLYIPFLNTNITCKNLLHKNCDRNLVCQTTENNEGSKCSCIGNYFGPNCDQDCETGYKVQSCVGEMQTDKASSTRTWHCDTPGICVAKCSDFPISTCNPDDPPDNSIYLTLLLLLLLPLIVWITYRFVTRKKNDSAYITPRPGSYIEVVEGSNMNTNTTVFPDNSDSTHHFYEYIKDDQDDNSDLGLELKNSERTASQNTYTNLERSVQKKSPKYINKDFVQSDIPDLTIKLSELEEYIRNAVESKEFYKHFTMLPQDKIKDCVYGNLESNKFKNRYKDIVPNDENRVKLDKVHGDIYSDYINANYINTEGNRKAYIATQHPKQVTFNDFWRLVWQENVRYIIMLTNLTKKEQKNYLDYWPSKFDESQDYGYIKVSCIRSNTRANYINRTFKVTLNENEKTITHMQFTGWEDEEIPTHPHFLAVFAKEILKIPQDGNSPILVHCSAGIGRTGVVILSDICLRTLTETGTVDVFKNLRELRNQRHMIINKVVHYKLVYLILLEYVLAPKESVKYINNSSALAQGNVETQLNYLQKITYFENSLFKIANKQLPKNKTRNRFSHIVPEYQTIHLNNNLLKNKNLQYINAVPVDGFKYLRQFIVTQNPLPNTVKDFWQMAFVNHVKVIISLNDIQVDDESSCEFWPKNNQEFRPIHSLSVNHIETRTYDFFEVHDFVFNTLFTMEREDDRKIHIIHLKDWKPNTSIPKDNHYLIFLYIEALKLSEEKFPLIVTCYDGVTACGLLAATAYNIQEMIADKEYDVLAATRVIRKNRKEFIINKEQLEYLYKLPHIYANLLELDFHYEIPIQ